MENKPLYVLYVKKMVMPRAMRNILESIKDNWKENFSEYGKLLVLPMEICTLECIDIINGAKEITIEELENMMEIKSSKEEQSA